MRVTDLNSTTDSGILRGEARVVWEDVEREPFDLFVETDARHGDLFDLDPNALLTMLAVPAWESRERRLAIDGALCPVLAENVRAAMSILTSWYYKVGHPPRLSKPVRIEAEAGYASRTPSRPRSMCLMSCGIDSLATFRWHRLQLPPDHASNIHVVLTAAFGGEPGGANSRLQAARGIAREAGVEALGVYTNLRELLEDGHVYSDKWHGSALTGLAALFSAAASQTYIASSSSSTDLYPWGSHPLLDPCFSSAHFQVKHHGLQMSRLEKTALVGDWPVGLQNIRVCNNDPSGAGNCGTCFKCITTMTSLVALGKLDGCEAFPDSGVTPELICTLREYEMIDEDNQIEWYCEMIPPLRDHGRTDLVAAIEAVLFA